MRGLAPGPEDWRRWPALQVAHSTATQEDSGKQHGLHNLKALLMGVLGKHEQFQPAGSSKQEGSFGVDP